MIGALGRLDTSPREACELARAAHEQARTSADAAEQAETALTLAIALNRLGEFREARSLAEQAASLFATRGDAGKLGRALCEAAWADTFIGDLQPAIEKIERTRATSLSPLLCARCDWIQARVLRSQARYPEAAALFEQARDAFQAAQLPLEAARCECELAHTYILGERGDPFTLLNRLRQTFESTGCFLDAALCDYLFAFGLTEVGRYPESLEILLQARQKFVGLRSGFLTAGCDMMLGIAYQRLNHLDESVQATQQARDYFLANDIRAYVSACDINLGNTHYMLNRYDEALALYQEAADLSLAEGRGARAARIYTNMGLVYAKKGLFSKSLDLHYRALQITTSKDLAVFAASNHAELARCYRQLGQYDEALTHLREMERLTQDARGERFAAYKMDLADLHLARGEIGEAVTCLEQARSTAETDGLDSLVAICDRLLAQATTQTVGKEHALARVENARTLFLKHAQTVDAALCDLTEGELRFQWNQVAAAQDCFQRARAVLAPAFPDQAWRTDYGLGRCAVASGDYATALGHYLGAVRTIAASRSALVTEQLSNDFFARRQSVFDEALSVALQQDVAESALEVIEASKARTFLTLLSASRRDWRRSVCQDRGDPYIADLIARERSLRHQLNALRRRVAVQAEQEAGEPVRGAAALAAISAAALDELNALGATYEAVVTQLRLAMPGLAGVSSPEPFSLAKLMESTTARFGTDWAALGYYLGEDYLVVVTVTPQELRAEKKNLSDYDRSILNQCSTADPDLRELIYRGTMHGTRAPSPGADYLRHLHRLLIPPGLDAATLIIAPHRALHALPFHALTDGDAYLIEQHALVYAPSLQVAQLLFGAESDDGNAARALVLGLSDFGDVLRALPHAADEVAMLREVLDGLGEFLWGAQATRHKLLDLDATGELRRFDVLHLATHAVLDSAAPHQSRVLLADDALTALDIFDLSLNARLVTLSACQTALGQGGQGDELLGLARAFFYAGARALLATLWQVEDCSMVELTQRFYRHWADGANLAIALRQAQIEMIRAGSPPYHWAPFVLMGQP